MNLVTVENVTKTYRMGVGRARVREMLPHPLDTTVSRLLPRWWNKDTFNALEDVSFSIPGGSSIGILGHNGAGKTTMLKVIAGVTAPTRGAVHISARIGALIDVTVGFHPELTGRENVYLLGAVYGFNRKAMNKKLDQILDFADIDMLADTPLKRFSSGMVSRLGFGIITSLDMELLLIDEVLAVGDASFQHKCVTWLDNYRKNGGSLLFVSHNLSLVRNMTQHALWLDHGRLVDQGDTASIIQSYARSMERRDDRAELAGKRRKSLRNVKARGLDRWGAGGARIAETRVEDSATHPPRVEVSIKYETSEMEEGVFCVGFVDASGRELGAAQSVPIPMGSTEGTVRCLIEPLPLRPGEYFPVVAILSSDGVVRDRWKLERPVVVDHNGNTIANDFGPFEIQASWTPSSPHPPMEVASRTSTPSPTSDSFELMSGVREGQDVKRIVVSNVYADDNKGGSAITMSTLQTIRSAFPDCSLSMMAINLSASSHRHTETVFPEIELHPSPHSSRGRTVWANIAALVQSLFALVVKPNKPPPALSRLLEADLVISKGGQVYVEKRTLKGVLGMWFTTYPIILASRYGVPTVVYSATIGPFWKRSSRLLTGWILRRASLVMPRDAHSLREALDLGVNPSRARQMPDTVFLLDRATNQFSSHVANRLGFKPGTFAIITVQNGWRAEHSEFLDHLRLVVKGMLEEGLVENIAIIVQVHGEAASDLASSRDFAEGCGDSRVQMVTDDLSPEELLALYGAARLTIACRVHSAIFSLIAGTPAYVVGINGPKAENLFAALGLRRFVIPHPHFDAGWLVEDIRCTLQDDELKGEIERIVSDARSRLEHVPRLFQELVDSPDPKIPLTSLPLSTSQAQARPSRPRLISVVMPVRNCGRTIDEQLRALADQDYKGDWEVVIADNGSTDDTHLRVSRWEDQMDLRLVDASWKAGVNVARNAGIAEAQGDFIAICDGDDIVGRSWLRAMSQGAEEGDLVGGPRETERLNGDLALEWWGQRDSSRFPVSLGFMPYIPGSNLGAWKDVLEQLDGFSENYAGGSDEIDLCWRAQLAGFKLNFQPEAVIHYRHRDSLSALAHQLHRYAIGNAHLYKMYREFGVPKQSRLPPLRSYAWLLTHFTHLLGSDRNRGKWIRAAAIRSGRLRGSLRYRTIFL